MNDKVSATFFLTHLASLCNDMQMSRGGNCPLLQGEGKKACEENNNVSCQLCEHCWQDELSEWEEENTLKTPSPCG